MGSRALLHRPELLQRSQAGAALSGRHGLQLLPCRPEPDPSPGRSRPSEMGRPQLDGRRAIPLDGPRLRLERGREELSLSARAFLRAGNDGHFARLDGLHQQPAHHERRLSPRPPPRRGQALGQGDAARPAAQQQAADRLLRSARHVLVAAGSERRFGFRRRPGGAQPRLHQHRPLQRRMDAPLQSFLRRQADRPHPDRDRGGELGLLAGDRGRHAAHGGVPAQGRPA